MMHQVSRYNEIEWMMYIGQEMVMNNVNPYMSCLAWRMTSIDTTISFPYDTVYQQVHEKDPVSPSP